MDKSLLDLQRKPIEFMNSNNSPDNGKMTPFYSRILQIVVFLCKVELLLINDFW